MWEYKGKVHCILFTVLIVAKTKFPLEKKLEITNTGILC